MANPALHPKVRERLEPRMSATALAEYLILQPDGQESVLHDSKFASSFITAKYADAMRALRSYHWDPRRPAGLLTTVKNGLTAKSLHGDTTPYGRDEALRCIEGIGLFEQHENALAMRGLSLSEPPRLGALMIEGVSLSIQPDFLVAGPNGRFGAGMLRLAKAPDPSACKTPEARRRRGDHRREMARYMIAMMQILLEAQRDVGTPDPALFFVADVRIPERIMALNDHTTRMKAVRAACRQIAVLWDSVEPRARALKG